MQNLANALQSGNLSGAQTAFTALEQRFRIRTAAVELAVEPKQPVNNDIQSLATALNSGNLSSAQQAFAQLQKTCRRSKPAAITTIIMARFRRPIAGDPVVGFVPRVEFEHSGSSSSSTGNTLNVTA